MNRVPRPVEVFIAGYRAAGGTIEDAAVAFDAYLETLQAAANAPPPTETPDDGAHDMAVDGEGRALPFSGHAVRSIVRQSFDDGKVLAVVLENAEGAVCVQVMLDQDDPTDIGAVLSQAAKAYAVATKGH